MSSNLPPGVFNDTYGAPWNEEDKEFTCIFHLEVSDTICGDKHDMKRSEYQRAEMEERCKEMKGIIRLALESHGISVDTIEYTTVI